MIFTKRKLEALGGNLSKALQPFIECTAAALGRLGSGKQGRAAEGRKLGGGPGEPGRFSMTQKDAIYAVN